MEIKVSEVSDPRAAQSNAPSDDTVRFLSYFSMGTLQGMLTPSCLVASRPW